MKTTQPFALTFVVLSLLGSRASAAITSTDEMNRAASKKQIPISGSSFSVAAAAEDAADTAPAKASIPWSQIGAKAGGDYQGDGLAVMPAAEGARLRCVFQRLEGEATREGLWLTSTVTNGGNDRFRVVAADVRRLTSTGNLKPENRNEIQSLLTSAATDQGTLPRTGTVEVTDKVVRFLRPGLTEEYSVSMDGVRQDFIIEQRPVGAGPLRVELEVAGAKVEPLADGARLVLENSGRKIAYSRLRVTDATGKELTARMEVASSILPDVEGAHPAARNLAADFSTTLLQDTPESAGLEAPALRQAGMHAATKMLAVVVNDADAVYPVRIDPTFSDANWISMGGIPGANDGVLAAVVDGSGNLYIGGRFTLVGDVFANGIAKWDGSSWKALGSGVGGSYDYGPSVSALAVSGSDLYAGGEFTTAGGVAAANIAKWNGSSWSALGSGMDNNYVHVYVYALAVSGSDLYAAGYFTTAGGSSATNIAKWDGSSWSALGSGIGGTVSALAVSGSDVYAGGQFTTAGGSAANSIAKWNGSSWSALGSGMGNLPGYPIIVYALAASGSNMYAGGQFTTAGGSAATNIAKWNGSSWSALGSGMNDGHVSALAVSGGDLYAGGGFTTAGGSAANHIAKWNGSSWSALGSGMNIYGSVSALAVSGSDLYAGGYFTTAGGSVAKNIAKWDGSSWTALGWGSGMGGGVTALAVSGSDVYAGGQFNTAGGRAVNNIAKWNGSSWSALGSGMYSDVYALAVSGSNVYAGGQFTTAGGHAANNVAKWNGSSWSALGSGIGGTVSALAVSGSDLYAGGFFTTAGGSAANSIAKWNGSSWSALGSGMDSYVYALAVSGSDLYAGGFFTTAGGSAANSIAKWNGSSWSALGSGMDSYVYALAVSGNDLYAGGQFTTAGGSAAIGIAKWNGSSWSPLGSGMNGSVSALALSGSDLYAGGSFTTAGGKVSAKVAKAYLVAPPGGLADSIVASSSGTASVKFYGNPGHQFDVQRTTSLTPPVSWTAVTTSPLSPAADGAFTFVDTNAPGSTAYYRAVER